MNSSARSSLITLTTDFGLQDHFMGQMKGVILKINPAVGIVDLTHGIPRHDIKRAASVLSESHRYFPRGSIHVGVVDPGVRLSQKTAHHRGRGKFLRGTRQRHFYRHHP